MTYQPDGHDERGLGSFRDKTPATKKRLTEEVLATLSAVGLQGLEIYSKQPTGATFLSPVFIDQTSEHKAQSEGKKESPASFEKESARQVETDKPSKAVLDVASKLADLARAQDKLGNEKLAGKSYAESYRLFNSIEPLDRSNRAHGQLLKDYGAFLMRTKNDLLAERVNDQYFKNFVTKGQLDRFVRDLDDDRYDVRETARKTLQAAGGRALGPLIERLKEQGLSLQQRALIDTLIDERLYRYRSSVLITDTRKMDREVESLTVRDKVPGITFQLYDLTPGDVSRQKQEIAILKRDIIPHDAEAKDRLNKYVRELDSIERLKTQIPKQLERLNVFCDPEDGSDLRGLASLRGATASNYLKHVSLKGVTDEDVSHFKNLPRLEALDFLNCSITNKSLSGFANAENIIAISLTGCDEITPAIGRDLVGMKNLETFSMSGKNIEPLSSSLAKLEKLQNLALTGDFGDYALEQISDCKNLTNLWVISPQITDSGMSSIGRCPRLKELLIAEADRVTSKGFAELAKLSNMEDLQLDGANLKGSELEFLKGMKKLKRLSLRATGIADNAAKSLGSLTSLEELDLWGADITATTIEQLSKLPKVNSLNLSEINMEDPVMLEFILKMKTLKHLRIGVGSSPTDNSLTAASISNLRAKLPDCNINVVGVPRSP